MVCADKICDRTGWLEDLTVGMNEIGLSLVNNTPSQYLLHHASIRINTTSNISDSDNNNIQFRDENFGSFVDDDGYDHDEEGKYLTIVFLILKLL